MSWKPGTPRFQDQGHQVNHGKVTGSPPRTSVLLDSSHPVSHGESGVRQGGSLCKQELPPEEALQRTGWFQTQPTCPGPLTSIHRRHFIDVLSAQ